MTYQVKLTVFEGPLDLLLTLIERRELDITAVSLAAVTDQYLEHMAALQEEDASTLADFLVIAAKLILIKSQALLPRAPATEGEDSAEDVAEDLALQLRAYKRFKEIAALLKERDEQGWHSYLRVADAGITARFQLEGVTLEDLVSAMRNVLRTLPNEEPPLDIPRVEFSIADKIGAIEELIARGRSSLNALLHQARSRLEVIVTFLALLELMKQRRVSVEQGERFGEIIIAPAAANGSATDDEAQQPV